MKNINTEEPERISIITAIEIKNPDSELFNDGSQRVWAYYKNFKEAESVITDKRYADFYAENGSFNYLVIEECKEGFDFEQIEHWYKWNYEKEIYESCEKPKCYENTINFGLG